MNESVENLSDAELLAIIRKRENVGVPTSKFERANAEWQMRQQQKILEATKNHRGGIFFEVGGDMMNHGMIQTDPYATVDIAVAGNYSSNNKAKIVQGELKKNSKEWYEKPLGMILIGVVVGLIVAGAVFYFHWN